MEWLRLYLMIGTIYVAWLLIVKMVFRSNKRYITDPSEDLVTSNTALFLAMITTYLLTVMLWPLVIMWRVIEYEMLDQKTLFYEKAFDNLERELARIMTAAEENDDE